VGFRLEVNETERGHRGFDGGVDVAKPQLDGVRRATAAPGYPRAGARAEIAIGEALRQRLFRKLADDLAAGVVVEFTTDQIIAQAEELGILPLLIGEPKHKTSTMGKRLAKWRGREFRDSRNRRFRFGHRRVEIVARHAVTNLEPAAGAAA
jgi:hypothetical protein